MGLKRRNPARTRLFTSPAALAVLSAPVEKAEVAPAETAEIAPVVTAAPAPPASAPAPRKITSEERHQMIARMAYAHAERAGFAGDPLSNWLRAEREIDAQLGRATI